MSDIKNPLKFNFICALVLAVLGVLVIFVPGRVADIGAYQFYCTYFGIIMLAGGLGFAVYFHLQSKKFAAFISDLEGKLVWKYDDAYYEGFVGELNAIQKKRDNKKFYILIAAVVVLTALLYFMSAPEARYFAFIFGGFLLLAIVLFVWVFPNAYRTRAGVKPYVTIVGEGEAYIMGRYHHWKLAKAKLKNHDNGRQIYRVLAINYQGMTVNGKMYREWNALMPKEDQEHIQAAKAMADKINKRTKGFENQGANKDFLERIFDKMLGRDK
ncbi:MAG: hypothetical protein Q4C55_05835 [Eubacterium sp.]|nr:hypothetical protein [Eubacterium sp.]